MIHLLAFGQSQLLQCSTQPTMVWWCQDLRWALSVVKTRGFAFEGTRESTMLIPLADFLNHNMATALCEIWLCLHRVFGVLFHSTIRFWLNHLTSRTCEPQISWSRGGQCPNCDTCRGRPTFAKSVEASSFFPECVARVPVSLWGSGGWGCVRSTLRLWSQPSASVRARTIWPCLWEVLQRWSFLEVSDVWLLRFAWQAWHFVTFRRVLERVENRFAWQAQYFCDVFRRCVAVFVAGAALWTCPSSFFVAGAAL